MQRDIAPFDARALPHLTEPRPLHFPSEEFVPESAIHLIVRTFLYELLHFVLSGRAWVGSDQFVYFDGADPRRCVAPDVYVVWGDRDAHDVFSWKTWERGTPALCIEIYNAAVPERRIEEKLAHYRSMGVRELVYFSPPDEPGKRLRVWDRIDDDLVERAVENDTTRCIALDMQWVVRPIERAEAALRLSHDASGSKLVLNRTESERAVAAARIAELEAELRRRGG